MFKLENQEAKIAEEWRAPPGFEGLYEVSDHGRVRRLVSRGSHKAGIQKLTLRSDGYLYTSLMKDGHHRMWLVHRLVLTTFVGPRPSSIHGGHINAIKSDNRLSNLHWCTPKENAADMVPLGLVCVGERNSMAKINADIVRAIRAEYRPRSRASGLYPLAKKYGISFQHVSEIVNRKCWTHVA